MLLRITLFLLTSVLAMPVRSVFSQTPHQHGDDMLMGRVGGFTIMAMAQAFPTFTMMFPREIFTPFATPSTTDPFTPAERGNYPLERYGFYVTQPALMANISSPDYRWVLRTTINAEGLTQRDGELNFGAWGEGFIDKRHPHTLFHELMLSYNHKWWSVSTGKGFAAYGTDDPMSRPVLKYPTNHHLSQVLERWNATGALMFRTWGLEASVFAGEEPTGPYDLDNFDGFGKSWSARLARRFGGEQMRTWPWELSASYAHIVETHGSGAVSSDLANVAVRHEHIRDHYVLLEASHADTEDGGSYYSILGEGAKRFGRHQPYGRVELSTRPEFSRLGPNTTEEFFRYDHDAAPTGATRWLITTLGYGYTAGARRISPRPFLETQLHVVRPERGAINPRSMYARDSFWSISAGVRIFFGGDPMRMGTYGVLDPMTAMHEPMPNMSTHTHH